ncbi:MAG TPA: chromate transporter [Alphaproteobacteria bacterium]|jgi:chromate transporter
MSDPIRRAGSSSPPLGDDDPLDPPPGLLELFWVFAMIGMMSFGGALSTWIHREISVNRRWMTETDVLSGLALAQVMPGINVVNLALFVGQRMRGVLGSFAAVMGMLLPPSILVVLISLIYEQFADLVWLGDMLNGIAAAAAGLLVNMGVRATRRSARNLPLLLIVVAIFVTVGIMHWPMVPVVLALAPISIWISYRNVLAEQRLREETIHAQ